MKIKYFILFFGVYFFPLVAQSIENAIKHSPTRAAVLSAVLPGSGQIYNRQWWKSPLYLGGLATTGYFAYINYNMYHQYKEAYVAKTDNDATTTDPYPYYSEQNLIDLMSYYRRNLELSIIGMAAVYTLNVLDAYVYAHFYQLRFDKDFTISLKPYFYKSMASVCIRLTF